MPYLHPHSRLPCSTTKSISGISRITVTAAVWLSSVRHSAGTSTQSSSAACNMCRPFSSAAPQPATVTPSPARKPSPTPTAAIFVYTSVSAVHVLPSYRRITLSDRSVSSHRSPVRGSWGASVPAA